jgi:hypothetical protein
MTFFVTFEHAVAKAIQKLKSLAVNDLPKVQAAVSFAQHAIPVAETVATVLDPSAASAIVAVGNASDAVLSRVAVALADEATFQAALSNGTVTIKMAADEIHDVKSLQPVLLGVVQAMGLGHTIPVAVTAAVAAKP